MARTRDGGGSTASAVTLTIFGLGFGICLVLAILFYTQKRTAEDNLTEAQDNLEQYYDADSDETRLQNLDAELTQADAGQSEAQAILNNPDRTVIGGLLDYVGDLQAVIATGANPRGQVAGLREKLNDDNNPDTNIGQQSLISAVNSLYAVINSQQQAINDLNENVIPDKDQEIASLEQEIARLRQDLNEQKDQLAEDFNQTSATFTSYRQNISQIQQQLESRAQQMHTENQDQIAQLEQTIRERDREIDDLQTTLRELKDKYQSLDAPDVVRADGRIVSVIEGQEQVTINLGRDDHITRAMTFEVFEAGAMPKADSFDEVRGKATIEVFEVNNTRSLARVVRRDADQRGEIVAEGDQVINVAYQPDATYTFYVHGQFNLDGEGDPTAAEAQRIKSIVKEWGGKVSENLSYDVDYVVIGAEPTRPDPLPESVINPTEIRQHNARMEQFRRYSEVIGEARDKNIPIMNQNRFLALVGYYERE